MSRNWNRRAWGQLKRNNCRGQANPAPVLRKALTFLRQRRRCCRWSSKSISWSTSCCAWSQQPASTQRSKRLKRARPAWRARFARRKQKAGWLPSGRLSVTSFSFCVSQRALLFPAHNPMLRFYARNSDSLRRLSAEPNSGRWRLRFISLERAKVRRRTG